MVIAKVIGGLSNQMFQYACAKSIAIRTRQDLALDLTWYDNIPKGDTFRLFELDFLQTDFLRISSKEIDGFRKRRFFKFSELTEEHFFEYDKRTQNVTGNLFLNGYWPSYRYFSSSEEIIRRQFLPRKVSKNLSNLIDLVSACNSVAVHVRRGDYITNSSASAMHLVASTSYYAASKKVVEDRTDDPIFFYFSDDLDWVRSNLVGPNDIVMERSPDFENWWDLVIMANCKNNIVSTSGYGWWSAYLNQNKEKVVTLPKYWVRDKSQYNPGLALPGWYEIENG